MGKSWV